jgi:hypothetical protein
VSHQQPAASEPREPVHPTNSHRCVPFVAAAPVPTSLACPTSGPISRKPALCQKRRSSQFVACFWARTYSLPLSR